MEQLTLLLIHSQRKAEEIWLSAKAEGATCATVEIRRLFCIAITLRAIKKGERRKPQGEPVESFNIFFKSSWSIMYLIGLTFRLNPSDNNSLRPTKTHKSKWDGYNDQLPPPAKNYQQCVKNELNIDLMWKQWNNFLLQMQQHINMTELATCIWGTVVAM